MVASQLTAGVALPGSDCAARIGTAGFFALDWKLIRTTLVAKREMKSEESRVPHMYQTRVYPAFQWF
jgi:hypothetical protein